MITTYAGIRATQLVKGDVARTATFSVGQANVGVLVALSSIMCTGIALNNVSLATVDLSLNQSIKAVTPVVTSIFSWVIEGQPCLRGETACLIVLSCGVACVVWDGAQRGETLGISLCLLATVCNACTMSLRGLLASGNIGAAQLNCITAPMAAIFLIPFVLFLELDTLLAGSKSADSFSTLLVLALSGAVAGAYNVVHTLMIERESAVTTAAIGQVKIVCLVLLSFRYLENARDLTPRMLIGGLVTFSSFAAYSIVKGARGGRIAARR